MWLLTAGTNHFIFLGGHIFVGDNVFLVTASRRNIYFFVNITILLGLLVFFVCQSLDKIDTIPAFSGTFEIPVLPPESEMVNPSGTMWEVRVRDGFSIHRLVEFRNVVDVITHVISCYLQELFLSNGALVNLYIIHRL